MISYIHIVLIYTNYHIHVTYMLTLKIEMGKYYISLIYGLYTLLAPDSPVDIFDENKSGISYVLGWEKNF